MEWLEQAIREDLNKRAPRVMGVLKPLKVIIENYPEGQVDQLEAINNPEDESFGTRQVPFSREIYIEASDFMLDPPKKYFRLAPGREVRLRYAYFIKCTGYEQNAAGEITAVKAEYDPATRGGNAPDGRKVQGTIHWVSAQHALDVEVRLYDRLFMLENAGDIPEGEDWKKYINPNSLEVLPACKVEPVLATSAVGAKYQFERNGYFCIDRDSTAEKMVINRTVTLKDTWAKVQSKGDK